MQDDDDIYKPAEAQPAVPRIDGLSRLVAAPSSVPETHGLPGHPLAVSHQFGGAIGKPAPPSGACGARWRWLGGVLLVLVGWLARGSLRSRRGHPPLNMQQPTTRRYEIERQIREKAPGVTEFDLHKMASAIDKHDKFDRPGSLYISAGLLDRELTLHSVQQGGKKKVVHRYPRIRGLEAALREAIDEQREDEYPVRREILQSSRKFFTGFPSLDGRTCNLPELQRRLAELDGEGRGKLQRELLEDFRWRLRGFDSYLHKRTRDVQQVLLGGWMPMDLRRAFAAFDLLCYESLWLRHFRPLPSSSGGRTRAARWLRSDKGLRHFPVRVQAAPPSQDQDKTGRRLLVRWRQLWLRRGNQTESWVQKLSGQS